MVKRFRHLIFKLRALIYSLGNANCPSKPFKQWIVCYFSVITILTSNLQVLLARQKADNKVYAVKVLQKAAIMKRNEVKHIMAERNVLLKNVIHPFLVGLHYSFQTADKLYFVLDYVNGGEVITPIYPERYSAFILYYLY